MSWVAANFQFSVSVCVQKWHSFGKTSLEKFGGVSAYLDYQNVPSIKSDLELLMKETFKAPANKQKEQLKNCM